MVAHNANFDTRMLMNSLQQVGIYDAFKEVFVGIADSFSLFRSSMKGKVDSFTLESLVMKFLEDVLRKNCTMACTTFKFYKGCSTRKFLRTTCLMSSWPTQKLCHLFATQEWRKPRSRRRPLLFQNLSLVCKKQYQWA